MKYGLILILISLLLFTACDDGLGEEDSFIKIPAVFGADYDSSSIARVLTDSFFSSHTLSGLWNPYGIAVDSEEGLLFWTDDGYDHLVRFDMKIKEQTIIASGLSSPADVAFDPVERMVYWADYGLSTISRCDEWGGSSETLLTNLDGLASPIGLALDIKNRYLYFTDEGNLTIERCNLDGSGLTLITGGLVSPHGIAYHHGQNKIYWATWETGTGNIMRCNIDGSNQEVLISPLNFAAGICLDEENDHIYYTYDFELRQCRTDGTQDKLVTPILNIPFIEFGYSWLETNNNIGFPEFPPISF